MKVHMMSILHIFRLKLIIISQIANLFMGDSLSLVHCNATSYCFCFSLIEFYKNILSRIVRIKVDYVKLHKANEPC
jgi:hypothetical protein